MTYEGVHRIVVVDDDQRVVGIVAAGDILRWLARRCGYLVPDVSQKASRWRQGAARVRSVEPPRPQRG